MSIIVTEKTGDLRRNKERREGHCVENHERKLPSLPSLPGKQNQLGTVK